MYSDDNLFEDNTFENGAAGTAIMYSERLVFRRNRFLRNRGFASVGLLFPGCDDVLAAADPPAGAPRCEANSFVGNRSPLALAARHTDTVFAGNSWSGNDEPDLDGDGRS